ncbi:MAG: hypothetical protein D4R43_02205 [Sphingobacteriales bacterium]|nr:MAG: hypothetical protein D4R43_02205 [Sphingobacteriales bacterium]
MKFYFESKIFIHLQCHSLTPKVKIMENQILDENISQSTEISFDERVNNLLSNGYGFDLGKFLSDGSKILGKNLADTLVSSS